MAQYSFGGTNPAALGVPDLFIQINPPPAAVLTGAPANMIGFVGSATWGPVNSPVFFGDLASGSVAFGPLQVRKYDMMTACAAATLQGANSFVGVRVSDGTDVAASVIILATCLTLTAKYTGSRGNLIQATVGVGSAAGTSKITIAMPGVPPETYDNIAGTGNALWLAAAAAINNGQNAYRAFSNLVTATAGAGTTAPVLATYNLASGTDGATTITSTVLLGADTSPRTGMYALRGTNLALMVLADCDTATSWTTQLAFAKSELCFAVAVDVAGDTIATFTTTQSTSGIDDPWIKVLFGDWCYVNDGVNNITRMISPQGFYAGAKAVMGPQQSALNRPINGIVGTQATVANKTYSATADLPALSAARGDVICTPSVGGAYFSARLGHNASSDPGRHMDNFATMTNYLAKSMGQAPGLGAFVGRLITPDEMREAASSIGGFLENEKTNKRIAAYSVQIDKNNNPAGQIAIGVQKATVTVTYLSTVEYFLVDFTGGQTVTPGSSLPIAA